MGCPVLATAASRLRRTIRFADGTWQGPPRRCPWSWCCCSRHSGWACRSAAVFDPNATVNAWGGPTYLGALLAHYLDNIVSFYAAAFLLSRLLLPATATRLVNEGIGSSQEPPGAG